MVRHGADWRLMRLDHEGLDVYQQALEFLVVANGIIEALPRGRSHLADQFTRASLSVVLNIAEGAGKHSKLDKRRSYMTARGSATFDHRSNRLKTVFHGPNASGRSRQGAPVRRHHNTASMKFRSSLPGRPARRSAVITASSFSHCLSPSCSRTIAAIPWSTLRSQWKDFRVRARARSRSRGASAIQDRP